MRMSDRFDTLARNTRVTAVRVGTYIPFPHSDKSIWHRALALLPTLYKYHNTEPSMSVNSPNVGIAFALVAAAGLATALGAAVVFFPSLVKLASRRVLASALGFSAGVMTYVSFVEIFGKSRKAFINYGETESNAYLYATLCFFGGVVVMLVSEKRSL